MQCLSLCLVQNIYRTIVCISIVNNLIVASSALGLGHYGGEPINGMRKKLLQCKDWKRGGETVHELSCRWGNDSMEMALLALEIGLSPFISQRSRCWQMDRSSCRQKSGRKEGARKTVETFLLLVFHCIEIWRLSSWSENRSVLISY